MDGAFLGLRHVALNVRDVRKSVEFYTRVIGMTIEWEPDADNVYLTSGTDNIAIHKLADPSKLSAVQSIDHIGFVVKTPEDVDRWATRLRELGIPFVKEPKTHRDGARSFYFRDPDGLLIQLIYHPPISDRATKA
jgi:catechol 2,3-dioxygenase-like lactoylglutathione lyase family enzyme